jgi:hypothetical protein
MYRFDTIKVLTNTETQTNAFYKIGAIVSLSGREKNTKVDRNGVVTYKSRKDRRRYIIDAFFIGIELSKVRKSNVDGHFSFMPYPVYKLESQQVPPGERVFIALHCFLRKLIGRLVSYSHFRGHLLTTEYN